MFPFTCASFLAILFFFQEAHPDYGDILKANIAFKNLVVCSYLLIDRWPVNNSTSNDCVFFFFFFRCFGCVHVVFLPLPAQCDKTRHVLSGYSAFSLKLVCYLYIHYKTFRFWWTIHYTLANGKFETKFWLPKTTSYNLGVGVCVPEVGVH